MLYNHVSSAFASISRAEQELARMKELGIGHIRIGVSTTLCKYILFPHLKKFLVEYPHIRVTLLNQSSAETLPMLEQHHIDIGLTATPRSMRNLRFLPVTDIQDIFVASPAYLENLALREGAETSPLSVGTVMLLDQKNMTRQHIDTYLLQHQIELPHIMEISTMDLLIESARIGLGIGCCIRECVQDDLNNGTLVQIPLLNPIPQRTIGFALSSTIPPSAATQTFLNYFAEEQQA